MILCRAKHFELMKRIRERVFHFLTLNVYFPFCKAVYSGQGKAVDLFTLTDMPINSLGERTSHFLKQNKLEPMPGYEAHDMKHTLLGFSADMKGEISMQYFEFGNGNKSLPVITVMLFGTLFMPEEYKEYLYQFRRGKSAKALSRIDLKEFAKVSIYQLKKQWKL